MFTVGATIGRPRAFNERPYKHISAEKLVFSAGLCYNGTNKKPLPLGEVAAKPTERVNGGKNTPSHPLSRELSQGESLWMRSFIFRGMGLALCLCNIKAKLAIKQRRICTE